ncbi:hypothetical protein [Brevibacillus sp. Leaf182]|uniref:hypothetical protein n=1 Tax=Brevibacillus sp. Leaf182 TaxID=1736290 RepID=UPI000700E600|nr:hypothetical protein [Brevibacillus sp. Leaf182]
MIIRDSLWPAIGQRVPENQFDHFSIQNAFYANLDQLSLSGHSVDVMVVDGPHGNGRSLAYPLFVDTLKPDALVLVRARTSRNTLRHPARQCKRSSNDTRYHKKRNAPAIQIGKYRG